MDIPRGHKADFSTLVLSAFPYQLVKNISQKRLCPETPASLQRLCSFSRLWTDMLILLRSPASATFLDSPSSKTPCSSCHPHCLMPAPPFLPQTHSDVFALYHPPELLLSGSPVTPCVKPGGWFLLLIGRHWLPAFDMLSSDALPPLPRVVPTSSQGPGVPPLSCAVLFFFSLSLAFFPSLCPKGLRFPLSSVYIPIPSVVNMCLRTK